MPLTPGDLLNNRYRIVTILGQGGMGSVYRAEDESLGISVAVKENLFLSDEYSRQFQREARILAAMRHPSLPRVIDYFSILGQGQYLVMDFVEGEDLRQRIERAGILPERDVVLIGAVACNALAYLHSRPSPIVHRDIKPGNIKITPEGQVVLVDFGLAKMMQDTQQTTSGARAMTPGYSPPEQYGTAPTDHRSDIYSLGATLYAALTGMIPEDGLMRMTRKMNLTPMRQLRQDIPRKLANTIEKALSVEPEDRYQSALEFKNALLSASDLPEITQQRLNGNPLLADMAGIMRTDGRKRSSPYMPSPPTGVSAILVRLERIVHWRWFYPALAAVILLAVVGVVSAFQSLRIPAALPPATATLPAPPKATPQATPTRAVTPSPDALPAVPVTPPAPTLTQPVPRPSPTSGIIGLGQVTFVSDRSGSFQVWAIDLDSGLDVQISNLPGGACHPDWSPDGKKLVVVSPCKKKDQIYPQGNLYILDADGSNPQRLFPRSEGDFDPSWSPDGQRLAFTSLRNGTAHIFIYNFNDSSLEEVSRSVFSDYQPSWGPGGKHLAFVRKKTSHHIWIMSDTGLDDFQYSSPGEINDYSPDWSPDGKFVVFSRTTLAGVPYIVRLDYEKRGTAQESAMPPITEKDITPAGGARISPDGKWVLYESWPDGRNHDIYLMDSKGGSIRRLTTDPGFDFDPAWRAVTLETQP